MKLPFRMQTEAGHEPVLTIDGAFGAPGLNLSHWPGNTTPEELRHELSTGIALTFAKLSPEARAKYAEGCTTIVNNHYDTDGACGLFALLHPEEALAREAALIDVAAAGDFFRLPSEAAFQIDLILGALADPERSPLDLDGLESTERYERAYAAALGILPALLDGDLEPYEGIWQGPLEDLRADLADLKAAAMDDLVHLDLVIWSAAEGRTSQRSPEPACFDPGRHALFGSTEADRVLCIGPGSAGTTYRMVLGTRSWFQLPKGVRVPPPRPDLEALAARLNGIEGCEDGSAVRWQAQSLQGASPELWFGTEDLGLFEEHAAAVLRPSSLPATKVKAEVLEALRSCWEFPDEDEEGDWMDV